MTTDNKVTQCIIETFKILNIGYKVADIDFIKRLRREYALHDNKI